MEPPKVECLVVMLGLLILEQYPADQESRKDEKQVDAGRAEAERSASHRTQRMRPSVWDNGDVVIEDDEENSESAKSVEFENASLLNSIGHVSPAGSYQQGINPSRRLAADMYRFLS